MTIHKVLKTFVVLPFSTHLYHRFSVMPLTDYSDVPKITGREKMVSISIAGCILQCSIHQLQKSRRGVFSTSRDAHLAV